MNQRTFHEVIFFNQKIQNLDQPQKKEIANLYKAKTKKYILSSGNFTGVLIDDYFVLIHELPCTDGSDFVWMRAFATEEEMVEHWLNN